MTNERWRSYKPREDLDEEYTTSELDAVASSPGAGQIDDPVREPAERHGMAAITSSCRPALIRR